MPSADRSSWDTVPRLTPLDFDKPNLARLTDALLGGRDHYASDRKVMDQVLDLAPGAKQMARDHRDWIIRVLRLLVGERRVDQFVDLGSGLPTVDNTHQVVQRYNPEARVIYVDNDPVVQAHGRALLEENDRTHVAGCDFSQPAKALGDPDLAPHLDLTRPVALMMNSVIHHIPDDTHAASVVRDWLAAVPSGSYLMLTHHYDPADGSEASSLIRELEKMFRDTEIATAPRSREQIASYFDGLELVPPGLTYPHDWWPSGPRMLPLSALNFTMLGAVARKP
ncbi:SAM-dependent methyltransferase [Actinokineospora sp. HUAS TT18]|uniref:SAM-dependent methyltransferase n=1 Tax=Actinokineospora sp. HUAS TT18 TaxID=3447451 RepID=UPI003F521882